MKKLIFVAFVTLLLLGGGLSAQSIDNSIIREQLGDLCIDRETCKNVFNAAFERGDSATVERFREFGLRNNLYSPEERRVAQSRVTVNALVAQAQEITACGNNVACIVQRAQELVVTARGDQNLSRAVRSLAIDQVTQAVEVLNAEAEKRNIDLASCRRPASELKKEGIFEECFNVLQGAAAKNSMVLTTINIDEEKIVKTHEQFKGERLIREGKGPASCKEAGVTDPEECGQILAKQVLGGNTDLTDFKEFASNFGMSPTEFDNMVAQMRRSGTAFQKSAREEQASRPEVQPQYEQPRPPVYRGSSVNPQKAADLMDACLREGGSSMDCAEKVFSQLSGEGRGGPSAPNENRQGLNLGPRPDSPAYDRAQGVPFQGVPGTFTSPGQYRGEGQYQGYQPMTREQMIEQCISTGRAKTEAECEKLISGMAAEPYPMAKQSILSVPPERTMPKPGVPELGVEWARELQNGDIYNCAKSVISVERLSKIMVGGGANAEEAAALESCVKKWSGASDQARVVPAPGPYPEPYPTPVRCTAYVPPCPTGSRYPSHLSCPTSISQCVPDVTSPMSGATNWVNKTWNFKDGSTQQSSILGRADKEYFDFIAAKETAARAGFFDGWMQGGGDQSNWQEFGIPKISASPTTPTMPTYPTYPTPATGGSGTSGISSGSTGYTCSSPEINTVLPGTYHRGVDGGRSICFGSSGNKYVAIPTSGAPVKNADGSIKIYDCVVEPISLCSSATYSSGTYTSPSGSGNCPSEIATLLPAGCMDYGNAWFEPGMSRYVLKGSAVVKNCSAEYIAGCTGSSSGSYSGSYTSCPSDKYMCNGQCIPMNQTCSGSYSGSNYMTCPSGQYMCNGACVANGTTCGGSGSYANTGSGSNCGSGQYWEGASNSCKPMTQEMCTMAGSSWEWRDGMCKQKTAATSRNSLLGTFMQAARELFSRQ